MAKRQRHGTRMSGEEFRSRRTGMALSVAEAARLLSVKEQTIRNIEGGQGTNAPGHQTAFLLKLLADPYVRTLATRLRDLEK